MTLHSVVIQKLLQTSAHVGKRAAASHHMKQFTYGLRNGQSILDSDRTLVCLRHAVDFIAALARDRHSRFLFVNTNPLLNDVVDHMTRRIGLFTPRDHIIWRKSGFLTNSFSPKKFKSRNKKFCLGLVQHPDCVVVLDTELKSSVIREADRMQIPIVALVDPSMPWEYYQKVAYPVPANDSIEFVYLFCNIITKTILLEKKKLKGLKEDTNREDILSDKKSSKGALQSQKAIDIDGEVLVMPYSSLTTAPSDIEETTKLLDKLVVVKINDNLGTTMGFSGPKSVIELCNGMTSLDFAVSQIESLNSKYGCHVPLLVLNTKGAEEDTKKVLEKHPVAFVDMLLTTQVFHGHSQQDSLTTASNNSELYSADHAAVFLSLTKSGTLDNWLSQGKEFVYILGADNVAASVDLQILSHLIGKKIDYCMEVIPDTSNESTNSLTEEGSTMIELRKISSVPTKDMKKSKSKGKFKFADTRSWWVNLKAIKELVDKSPKVDNDLKGLQEELAGSAVRLFNESIAISVPQSRFLPLYSTSDLLLLQSDLYTTVDGNLIRNPARANTVNPSIELGPEFVKVDEFQMRFKSIPSIVDLDSLKVTGDVWFGSGVTLKGRVSIVADFGTMLEIPDGAVLKDREIRDPADLQ